MSMLSPPDERDKMRTHPNCHNCHRLPPTVTNTHGKNSNSHGKNTGAHGKTTGAECGVKAISAIGCAAC